MDNTPGICGACDKPQHRHEGSGNLARWVGDWVEAPSYSVWLYEHGFAVGDRAKYADTKLCIDHVQMLHRPVQLEQLMHDIDLKRQRSGVIHICGSSSVRLIYASGHVRFS